MSETDFSKHDMTAEDFYKARDALMKANVPEPYFYFTPEGISFDSKRYKNDVNKDFHEMVGLEWKDQ